jgi:hypothetical protein
VDFRRKTGKTIGNPFERGRISQESTAAAKTETADVEMLRCL